MQLKLDKKTTKTYLEGIIAEREKQTVRANFDYHYSLISFAEHGGEGAITAAKDEVANLMRFVKDEEAKGEKKDKAKILIWQAEMNRLDDKIKGLIEVKKAISERYENVLFVDEVNKKLIDYVNKLLAKDPMAIYENLDKKDGQVS